MLVLRETILDINDMKNAFSLLSKKIKKRFGRNYILDIYIVGGASMLFNSYRDSTQDIDAYLKCDKYDRADILTLVYEVADELDLSTKWLNDDFKNTDSYTQKIINPKCYTFQKTYNQCLNVFIVKPIYVLCMKLMSFRENTNDINDIINIIKNNNFELEDIENAFAYLYEKSLYNSIGEKAYNLILDLILERN